MTNSWIDIKTSDCIMIIGSNAAENHPMSFKWVQTAMDKGATLISVDPRFTRTSSKADIYAPLRPGTDIAFIGGLINYTIENKLYNKEYIVEYTNAGFLIDKGFDFKDGLFSGYDAKGRKYDNALWKYQTSGSGIPIEDKTLENPRCVFQLLKAHFARYNVDTVNKITGTPKDVYLKVAKSFCATGEKGRAGTIMYAMGATQHTKGSQNIRAYSILQLLLGNMGVAGGGVQALRGESNVQGSTDYALLFHLLPGYLKIPVVENTDLKAYIEKWTPKTKDPKSMNYWKNTPKFIISLLKAWWGEKATKENDFCYQYLPKTTGAYSWIPLFEAMYDGKIKGLMVFGMNPAVAGPNVNMEVKAMENLDWMVAVDLWETETANFWQRPGTNPQTIKTEVFLLPAAASFEKEGSITNSARWMQWRYQATLPVGEARSDLWILDRLFRKIRALYQREAFEGKAIVSPGPILDLTWNYGTGEEPNPHLVAREINGYDIKTGKLLPSFKDLQEDGSTSCGCWIYCGSYTENGNMAARREPIDPTGIGLYPEWAWCWPVNRRILYNRASCDAKGNPWDTEHPVIRWNGKKWIGDVPDYKPDDPPEAGIGAFIMLPEGHARLFGPGLKDGPFPEHYEPFESPVKNIMFSVQINPAVKIWAGKMDLVGKPTEFPIIATTYRLSEHWQAGAMTRNLPWLAEVMPELFVEMSKSLAQTKGIRNGEKVMVKTARGNISAIACVTNRFKPFKLNGKMYEQIGIPWHFGFKGIATGDSANCLTPHVGDANTMIPEYKAFLCDVINGVI